MNFAAPLNSRGHLRVNGIMSSKISGGGDTPIRVEQMFKLPRLFLAGEHTGAGYAQ